MTTKKWRRPSRQRTAAATTWSSPHEAGQGNDTSQRGPATLITAGSHPGDDQFEIDFERTVTPPRTCVVTIHDLNIPGNTKAEPLPNETQLADAILRLIKRACVLTGGVLQPGTPGWWAAPATVQLASVAVLGQEYIPTGTSLKVPDPLTVANPLRYRPRHAELQQLRATPATPLRCGSSDKCTAVVVVNHPLPVWLSDVRCSRHTQQAEVSAA